MLIPLLLALAALLAAFVVWGLRLPRTRHAEGDLLINAPQLAVWQVLNDFLRQVEWRSDLKSVEMGAPAPDTPTWTERPRRGRGSVMRVVRRKEARLLEIERLPNGLCSGQWSITLEPAARATRATVTETLHIPNPLARAFARLWLDRENAIEIYLRDLKQRVEDPRTAPGS